ncbi:MAG: hypothetical protein C4539_03570 [Ignavibacteriales bacterium]|nr:MAG: hypothetical protein C4539_03570 [Ignavibacteriales bacterium]
MHSALAQGKTPKELDCLFFGLLQIYFEKNSSEALFTRAMESWQMKITGESENEMILSWQGDEDKAELKLIRTNDNYKLLVNYLSETMTFIPLPEKYNHKNGILYFINDTYLSGKYTSAEDTTVIIRFLSDGTVTGFPGYNEYSIPLMCAECPQNINTITLKNRQTKDWALFKWERVNNNLIFYNLIPETEDLWDANRYKNAVLGEKYLELLRVGK